MHGPWHICIGHACTCMGRAHMHGPWHMHRSRVHMHGPCTCAWAVHNAHARCTRGPCMCMCMLTTHAWPMAWMCMASGMDVHGQWHGCAWPMAWMCMANGMDVHGQWPAAGAPAHCVLRAACECLRVNACV